MNIIQNQKKRPSRTAQVCACCVGLAIIAAGLCNMVFCLHEKHVEQRRNEANCASTEYVRERAEAGDCICQCELGLRLMTGDRVEEDGDQAFLWLLAAAEQGYEPARDGVYRHWHYYGNGAALWERDPVVRCRIERLNKFERGDGGPNGRFVRFVRKTDQLIGQQAKRCRREERVVASNEDEE